MKPTASHQPDTGHRIHRTESFNLVELSLAIAVVAIGVVSVFGILPHLLKSSRQAVDSSGIALNVQDFMDSPERRGLLTFTDLENTNSFPTNNQMVSVSDGSFTAQRHYFTTNAVNASASLDPLQSYTNVNDRPLLKTLYITYKTGETNNPNTPTFTFITEAATTENILSP